MKNKSLKTLDIITVLMKNDRVREFEWLDTRSWEEDRYSKQIMKDQKSKWRANLLILGLRKIYKWKSKINEQEIMKKSLEILAKDFQVVQETENINLMEM